MSTSDEDLTYGQKLEERFPHLFKQDNIWALVCVGDNLQDPAEGWSGFSLVPVYSEEAPFNMFFGNMSDQLLEFENIAPFMVERSVTQAEAYRVLSDIVGTSGRSPVIVSSNAHTWVKPILEKFEDTVPFKPTLVCLRDLFSAISAKAKIPDKPTALFQDAKKLPQKFGLFKIAEKLGVNAGFCPTKAQHRVEVTAACVKALLKQPYISSED